MSGEISKGTLTEDAFSEIERLINASIHELVFALQHLDQSGDGSDPEDDIESAQGCLTTAGMNVDRIQEMISGSAVCDGFLNYHKVFCTRPTLETKP